MNLDWIGAVAQSIDQNKQFSVNDMYYHDNRAWAEKMASNQEQRHVRDLQAAGLNPMLGYMGTAAMPSVSPPQAPASHAGAAFNSGGQAASAQAKLMTGQTNLLDAQRRNIDAQTSNYIASAGQSAMQTQVLAATLPKITAEIKDLYAGARLKGSQSALVDLDADKLRTLMPILYQIYSNDAVRASLDLPRADNRAAFERTWWGRLMPYLDAYRESQEDVFGKGRGGGGLTSGAAAAGTLLRTIPP